MPPALGIAIMLLLLAGGLLYAIYFLRRHAEDIKRGLAGGSYRLGWPRHAQRGRPRMTIVRRTRPSKKLPNGLNIGRLAP